MNTVGYVMLLSAALVINAVARGRAMHLFSDLGEAFTAAIQGDYTELKAVLTASGDDLTADPANITPGSDSASGATSSAQGGALLSEMHRLAGIANDKYILGTTGPNSYDCSGLVWRALKNLGVYTGARFTTGTFALAAKSFAAAIDNPTVGDIVVWKRIGIGHMGVVSGKGQFYSALNRKEGIREAKLSVIKGSPRYFRIAGGSDFSINPNKGKAGQGLGVDAP